MFNNFVGIVVNNEKVTSKKKILSYNNNKVNNKIFD